MFYTMGIMTNVSCYAMIRVSPEERSRYDVPDPADVHIIDRPDADNCNLLKDYDFARKTAKNEDYYGRNRDADSCG